MRAVCGERRAVHRAKERFDLALREPIAGAHDGVAGDLGEHALDEVFLGRRAALGP